jgi:hypothetical protein
MVAPQKRGRLTTQDNKRSDGAIEVRQIIRALNKCYSGSLTLLGSPVVHSFNADYGYNAIKGWVTNDGDGNARGTMLVEFTRDGIVWGDPYELYPGESFDLDGLDVHSLRLTFVALEITYRIWQA